MLEHCSQQLLASWAQLMHLCCTLWLFSEIRHTQLLVVTNLQDNTCKMIYGRSGRSTVILTKICEKTKKCFQRNLNLNRLFRQLVRDFFEKMLTSFLTSSFLFLEKRHKNSYRTTLYIGPIRCALLIFFLNARIRIPSFWPGKNAV